MTLVPVNPDDTPATAQMIDARFAAALSVDGPGDPALRRRPRISAPRGMPRAKLRCHCGYHPADSRYRPCWWGTWILDPCDPVLWEPASGCILSLDDAVCSSQVLDMVVQIYGHDRDGQLTYGLVGALRDIIDPQANLCPWGDDKHLSKAAVRRMCAEAAKDTYLVDAGQIGKCSI